MTYKPQTLFEKIWDAHVVSQAEGAPAILYIDLQLVHEVTSPQAFTELRNRQLPVRRPDRTVATVDHSIPTYDRRIPVQDALAAKQLDMMYANARDFGIRIYDRMSDKQGIVHVIGPELGLTQPGMTIVCGDSHTSTHGAFGTLAFGIGTSEVAMVLATQTLLQRKPKTMNVRVEGKLAPGVTAKDIILALIAKIGVDGGTGHAVEYSGSAIRAQTMEGRMTICNMSIEGGARAGMIAPDETTFNYVHGREFAPQGADWGAALARWKLLPTDEGAEFDAVVELDGNALEPMITYGNNPGMGIPITARVPDPDDLGDHHQKAALRKALAYMDLQPGKSLIGHPINVVFIGSCTNSRIGDLRLAANIMKGKRVAENVRVMVVPGSQQVKRQAEQEGLDQIFKQAGAEWREAGCSACISMNGDEVPPGEYCVSTSNRNFEGRQGKGARTMLASPLTAAATALNGVITDPRSVLHTEN
jgi:3-isopropylmalate/(R)-2-methylmalate dehydratase large subunit